VVVITGWRGRIDPVRLRGWSIDLLVCRPERMEGFAVAVSDLLPDARDG